MIRKAVGAIVKHGDEFLLVHKVKIMNSQSSPIGIKGEWDFPKGGVKPTDTDMTKALLRELEEETGSDQYVIIKEFEELLSFKFSASLQKRLGFERQETTMFLVEYMGEMTNLVPQDEEIDQIEFFSREEVIERLFHEETRDFFKKHAYDS
ncbi:MAG: NUDIX domain-containing protein [Candidatus Hodarchaeota archaeon]